MNSQITYLTSHVKSLQAKYHAQSISPNPKTGPDAGNIRKVDLQKQTAIIQTNTKYLATENRVYTNLQRFKGIIPTSKKGIDANLNMFASALQ
jgi:hypothetical protein